MPTIKPKFLQLKNDWITLQQTWWPTVLFWTKQHEVISLARPLILHVNCNSIFQWTI